MLDPESHGYEKLYYVHEEDSPFMDGEEFMNLEDAVKHAKRTAEFYSEDYVYVITEVLLKRIKHTHTVITRLVEIEDY